MDILPVDVLPPSSQDEDEETSADHALLRLHASSRSLRDGSDDADRIREDTAADEDSLSKPASPSVPSRSSGARRRRKIGKGIQLVLLRKYVQCAKELNRLPDRGTTEQLLEQGYDEFYYRGGNVNEPRLSYPAFLKLVRNRRSEVVRQARGEGSFSYARNSTKRGHKEQMEIRALIDELEHVRRGQARGALAYDALGATSGSDDPRAVVTEKSVPILSDASSILGDTGTEGGGSAGDLSTGETYSSALSGTEGGHDDVVVSRSKLDLMLQTAQATLVAQKKLLEEVRAIEQRVAGLH
ncbi:hypothetical protein PsorP6_018186 [Peronosclerospora sorghi]|uniref:Uncharacterized protein n=1 Tax=Peronosclerospora sorghi TaxID=230839 RepID=A0ACC0WEF5_9STRA|nr:hypothetical protein PsorP6_018186 [Peronosclerospora sorghi]